MERNAITDSDDEVTVLESSRCDQDTSINFSLNRSGLTQTTKSVADVSTQTDVIVETVKPLQSGVRNFDENIKTALALSCSRAGITTEQARQTFQTASVVFFGMKYHLSPQDTEVGPLAKKPHTLSDYNSRYTNVLPSSKVIADTKHLLAIQQERNAA